MRQCFGAWDWEFVYRTGQTVVFSHSSWTDTESCGYLSEEELNHLWGPEELRRPLNCSHDCPPPRPRCSVSRSQSALCCSVLFTLFVVLNLIVIINIFDLLCIWQPYVWKCFLWSVLHSKMYLLGSLYYEIFCSLIQKQYFKKQKYSFIVLVLR